MERADRERQLAEMISRVESITDMGPPDAEIIRPVASLWLFDINTSQSCGGHIVPYPDGDTAKNGEWPYLPYINCGVRLYEEEIELVRDAEGAQAARTFHVSIVEANREQRKRVSRALDTLYREHRPAISHSERLMIQSPYRWGDGAFRLVLQNADLSFQMANDDRAELARWVGIGRREFTALGEMLIARYLAGRL